MSQAEEMLFATEDQQEADRYSGQPAEIASEKYLIFSSDGLMYGIKAEIVKDITTDYTITYLPQVPPFVRGVINLRGQIVPIIDIRLRLGKEPRDNFCCIVVDADGSEVGILVDMVEQMVDVPLNAILPVPTSKSQAVVTGMWTLPNGNTMLELDCELMLHG
ncbi:chemotaxis protein CheW [Pseudoflavonifractor sp. 60]|uniref:chemotaxis protein CheW n=1 Tax=Pseudoflavonifractor sp. 60 TaxID=2304576 RepID=UPI001370E9D9|nr:chemotaxis protein CheW [Pseudoflavonifractor sp. 60]NBI67707.1 chemotaxis protein CheW [Pseudoflavonifractor sp. 60]